MVTLEEAEENPEEYLGRDIMLSETDDVRISSRDDFAKIISYDNLKQAIIDRLKTAQGELTLHANYGSRLHELIGQNGNDYILSLAKMYTKEALLQEPRIEEDGILKISPSFRDVLKTIIDIEIEVQPITELEELNLVFSLFITEGTLSTEVQ